MENLSIILKKHALQWKDLMATIHNKGIEDRKVRDASLAGYDGKLQLAPELVRKQIKDMEKRFDLEYAPQSGSLARELAARQSKELEPYQPVLKNFQSAEEIQRRAIENHLQKEREEREKTH